MIERMIGAARLDVHVFEDVENDTNATMQALLIVVIVAIAGGIGGILGGPLVVVLGIIGALVQWVIWALITLLLGTTIFNTPQTHANWGQMARVTGFAQSPGVLKVLGIIPAIGPILVLVITIWQAVAMVIGVRQALDYESTWRAVGVVVVGFIVVIIINALVYLIAGPAIVGNAAGTL